MNHHALNQSTRSTIAIDLVHRGRERYIAGCLLECANELALLDPGPSSTLPILRAGLEERGQSFSDVRTILLTHIHLDHAGSVGVLLQENPSIRVFVHQRGAPHLTDPTRLLGSASKVLGRDVQEYWGIVLPVPGKNIQTLEGGEKIVLGNRTFHASYTPGHAIHHVCFFEYDSGIAFVGDAAGIRISDEFVYPATPPPDVNLRQLDESLDIIQAWRPEHLFLTHFGLLGNVDWHFSDFRDRLRRWSEFVLSSLDRHGDDTLRAAEFSEMVTGELSATLKPADAARHEKLISARQNWYGLAQYWRRREKSNPKSVT